MPTLIEKFIAAGEKRKLLAPDSLPSPASPPVLASTTLHLETSPRPIPTPVVASEEKEDDSSQDKIRLVVALHREVHSILQKYSKSRYQTQAATVHQLILENCRAPGAEPGSPSPKGIVTGLRVELEQRLQDYADENFRTPLEILSQLIAENCKVKTKKAPVRSPEDIWTPEFYKYFRKHNVAAGSYDNMEEFKEYCERSGLLFTEQVKRWAQDYGIENPFPKPPPPPVKVFEGVERFKAFTFYRTGTVSTYPLTEQELVDLKVDYEANQAGPEFVAFLASRGAK